jgi:hypothetical protein
MSDGLASALGATLIRGISESVKQAIRTGSDPAKLNPVTWISGPTIYCHYHSTRRIMLPLPHLVALIVPL